ncbi:MAG: L-aspartate oxidase, partial [Acidimicrobiaceae bacterium]|nr:L-aspartate oxidase [Acidimicrobiaceae bacterium]
DEVGLRVGVLTKADLDQAATRWAQGGVAAVLGGDPDSTDLHLADTLGAGAGLCDVDAVRVLVDEGPIRVQELIAMGAVFDRDNEGRLLLAREGGHSLPRIVHAGGAATGFEIERALVTGVRATATAVWEQRFAVDLIVEHGRCQGVVAIHSDSTTQSIRARHVLLTTGGSGQIFAATTNPVQSTSDGVAMALRAGVPCADIEFMQFHPTALLSERMPRPLLSEALRGHGALIRDRAGERFVDELLPRDRVARAITAKMIEEGTDHVWLDATGLESFDERFPTIAADLRAAGLDPATDWLPIAPAAHYHCGGVVTDLHGATALPGLWAAGEVACTGVHGANRLASNSLLEGMVFGPRVIEAIGRGVDGPSPTGAMRSVVGGTMGDGLIGGRPLTVTPSPAAAAAAGDAAALRDRLQRVMTRGAGVLRSAESLTDTAVAVAPIAAAVDLLPASAAREEMRNLTTVATAIVVAATAREESRGCHTRADFPDTDPSWRVRLVI